jgi:hypothetical protein
MKNYTLKLYQFIYIYAYYIKFKSMKKAWKILFENLISRGSVLKPIIEEAY